MALIPTRLLAAGALMLSLTGCYSLGLNAQPYTKPISVSGTVGRPATVVRHFRFEVITWYLGGLLPIATFPGSDTPWLPADKLVMALIHKEIVLDGDGVVNLRVRQSVTPATLGMQLVPAGAIALIPGSSPWAGGAFALAFQPVAVTVEGDVVKFTDRGGL